MAVTSSFTLDTQAKTSILSFYQDDIFLSSYTYNRSTNLVTITALLADVTQPLNEYLSNVQNLQMWIATIQLYISLDLSVAMQPFTQKFERTANRVNADFTYETVKYIDAFFKLSDLTITIKARPSGSLPYRIFQIFIETHLWLSTHAYV